MVRAALGFGMGCLAALAVGCGGGGSAARSEASAAPRSSLPAVALAGPFADEAAFCAHLGHPACAANDEVLMLMSSHRAPVKLRSGAQVSLRTLVSRDREAQRAHLVFDLDGKLWAPAEAFAYDPSGGKRLTAAVMRFTQQEDAAYGTDQQFEVAVSATIEVTPGGQAETEEYSLMCRVGPKPACLRAPTALILQDSLDTLNAVKGANAIVMLSEKGGVAEVRHLGNLGPNGVVDPARTARLLPEGTHRIAFP